MFTSYKVQHQKVKKTYHAVRVVQCQWYMVRPLTCTHKRIVLFY